MRNPNLHARWLNMFSYLEYIGFRKIVKSQGAENLSLETLGHAVEEGRHALMLKKFAFAQLQFLFGPVRVAFQGVPLRIEQQDFVFGNIDSIFVLDIEKTFA